MVAITVHVNHSVLVYIIQSTLFEGGTQKAPRLRSHLPVLCLTLNAISIVVYVTLTMMPSVFPRNQGFLQLAHDPPGVLQRRVCGRLWHPAPDAPEWRSGGGVQEAGNPLWTAGNWERFQVEDEYKLQKSWLHRGCVLSSWILPPPSTHLVTYESSL